MLVEALEPAIEVLAVVRNLTPNRRARLLTSARSRLRCTTASMESAMRMPTVMAAISKPNRRAVSRSGSFAVMARVGGYSPTLKL